MRLRAHGHQPGRRTARPQGVPLERNSSAKPLGDVNGARLLLDRSLALGDERAAFRLAETYDPSVLAERGLRVEGDAAKARTLYLRAAGKR